MAPVKLKKDQIPVFVFLDENISCARFEKLKSAKVDPKYKLRIIPFPTVMEGLGIFDFQVVLWLKKMVVSKYYPIRAILHQNSLLIFIFLTKDRTFIRDAETGFQSWKGNKKRKHQYKDIKLYHDSRDPFKDFIGITINNEQVINISMRYIDNGKTQQANLDKMIKSLERFLSV